MADLRELLKQFDRDSAESWLERIRGDLKGRDPGSLTWHSPEGIAVKPFYTEDDLVGVSAPIPEKGTRQWHIIERILVSEPADANARALESLGNGAESILFDLNDAALDAACAGQLLKGIHTEMAPVAFCGYSGISIPGSIPGVAAEGVTFLDDRLLYSLRSSPAGSEFDTGSFWSAWKDLMRSPAGSAGIFTIDCSPFKESGADHVQELAFMLGLAHEYLHHIDQGAVPHIRIRMAVSGNFFFEIGKLKAVKRLMRMLAARHRCGEVSIYLECTSARINKSYLDSNTNMLRNTAECMSAVIGGADGICITPHDLDRSGREAGRWAANISHLLRHESHFDAVVDPSLNSYYIESLTGSLAEKAWSLFAEMEKDGGFIAWWTIGRVEAILARSLERLQEALAMRRETLIGVNDYPDLAENPDLTAIDHVPGLSDLRLPGYRLALPFEQLRRRTQESAAGGSRPPRILLARGGEPSVASARVNYAANFMACAGWQTEEKEFDEAGSLKDADLVVICTDDACWEEAVVSVRAGYSGRLWLAGNPKGLQEPLANQLDGLIYRGCNVLAILTELQSEFLS